TRSSTSTSAGTTARTRCACRAVTVPPIPSAIPRLEPRWRALADRRRARPVPRAESGDGLAAGRGQRAGGAARRRGVPHAVAAWRRPLRGDGGGAAAGGDPGLGGGVEHAVAHRRRRAGHRVRRDAARVATAPPGARTHPAATPGLVVLPDGDRARRRVDARAGDAGTVRALCRTRAPGCGLRGR